MSIFMVISVMVPIMGNAFNEFTRVTNSQNAKKTQDSYNEEKGADDKLLKKSATETISECMTQENFDKPINEFTDDDLNDKVNLSKSKIEDGAPTVVGKGDDWRKKNFEEAEKRTKGSKPKGEQEA